MDKIDWKEFKKLPKNEQIELFNSALIEIKHLENACTALGFKKSTVQSHFKAVLGCTYNKDLNIYEPLENVAPAAPTTTKKVNKKAAATSSPAAACPTADTTDLLKVINKLQNNLDHLTKEFKEMKNNSTAAVVLADDIVELLHIAKKHNYSGTSIRVDKDIFSEFKKFCTLDKFIGIQQQTLLSLALAEYMERHK